MVHGELGKSLTRMCVGYWCDVIPVVETTLLPRTMLLEIWLRSSEDEMAEPDDAGMLIRYKKELLTGIGIRSKVRESDYEGGARAGLHSRDEVDLPRFPRGQEKGLVVRGHDVCLLS